MKLKIGGHNYKVVYTEDKNLLGKEEVGCLDREKGTIYIFKDLIKSEQELTLLHKILHCINGELSETTVDSLAQQLYQVVTDNSLFNNKQKHANKKKSKY